MRIFETADLIFVSTSFSTTISVSYLEVIESDDEEDVFSIDALGLAGLFKLWEATWLFDFSIGIISRVCFYVLFRFAVLAFHGWFTARVVYWPKQDWRFNSNQIFMTLCKFVFGVIFIWIWTSYVWPHFVFIILSWVFSLHGDKHCLLMFLARPHLDFASLCDLFDKKLFFFWYHWPDYIVSENQLDTCYWFNGIGLYHSDAW